MDFRVDGAAGREGGLDEGHGRYGLFQVGRTGTEVAGGHLFLEGLLILLGADPAYGDVAGEGPRLLLEAYFGELLI